MRISLALGVLVAATPVSSAAQEICESLDRIVQASREVPAFASVQAALSRGEPPMHWSSSQLCAVEPGVRVTCSRWGGGLPVEWEEIETCPNLVPDVPRPDRNRRRRVGGPSFKAYTVSGLRLEYGSGCTVCVVIRHSFSITLDGRTPPE